MKQFVGVFCLLGGIGYALYEWVKEQRIREKRMGEFIRFLHKSIFAMQVENVRLIEFFKGYMFEDAQLQETIVDIAQMLEANQYPTGEYVWEKAFCDKKNLLSFEEELFEVILKSGAGFFGRNTKENVLFLERSIEELERIRIKIKEKEEKERKVFIPVGMLGGIMMIIILI